MRYTILLAALAAIVALGACDVAPPTASAGPGDDAAAPRLDPELAARIGAGVAEAVAEAAVGGAGVRVMVALDPSALAGASGAGAVTGTGPGSDPAAVDRAGLVRGVSDLVDGFLARVGPESLRPVRRFAAVPAVAGMVVDPAALARLATDPVVLRVDLDQGGGGGLASSVPHIGAHTRHARGNDGRGVVVAVLDTGVDTEHPALAGRVVHEACFGQTSSGGGFCHNGSGRHTGAGAARDDAGHGTHVTGIVAASGAGGPRGVAPAANIVAVKVMDNCSFAGCFQAFSEIVAALDYLITNQSSLNVRVINLSLGTNALYDGACDMTTAGNMAASQAINRLRDLGVVAVASSMNNGSSTQMASPACLEKVLAVGSVSLSDHIAASSNGNAHTALLAPGVQIASLAVGGGTRVASGTSMAAPHAAGCAALLVQASPALSADRVADRLRESPVWIVDSRNDIPLPRLDCSSGGGPPDPEATTRIGRPGGP